MPRYRCFFPHTAFTALDQIKRKLRTSKPVQDYSQAPANESILPQQLYPQEIYEPIFQINQYQMPEPQEEPLDIGSTSMIIPPAAQQENFEPESMPEELEQEVIMLPEEEIEAAIDEASGIVNQNLPDAPDPMEEANMNYGNLLDGFESLEEMLDDPLQENGLMDEMEQMQMPFGMFYFQGMF